MTPITHNGWRLVDAKGNPVIQGSVYATRNGVAAIIDGGRSPHKPSSSGFVYTYDGREYYAHVYDLKWVPDEPTPPPGYTAAELDRDNPYNQWMENV